MLKTHLSTGQLAEFVGRSPATIRRYEASGLIPRATRDPISRRRFWTRVQADSIRRRLMPIAADGEGPLHLAHGEQGLRARTALAGREHTDVPD